MPGPNAINPLFPFSSVSKRHSMQQKRREPASKDTASQKDSTNKDQTASDNDVKLKSFTLIGGTTTAPPASVPASRTAGPIASRLFSMNSGESLNRKFLIAFEIFPFSIRNVPSRVRPV